MSYFSIDFGTSNTVITRWNPILQQAETLNLQGISQPSLPVPPNPPVNGGSRGGVPSLVYVQDARQGKILMGQSVLDRGLDLTNDPRFFRSFKRGIGAPIQGFLPELDEEFITFEKIGAWFLNGLIETLQKDTEETIQSLVLTVPVDSFETYRNWLSKVCQGWNIEQIRLIDEPTAAALGYGTPDESLLLVVDFGGGTIDLSLVQLDSGNTQKNQGFILKWGEKLLGTSSVQKAKIAKVLAKAGTNLGGSDLDYWLVDHFHLTQNVPKSPLITRLAERVKIQLSTQTYAQEVYFNDETFESYDLALERDQFEKILQQNQFFQQLDELMTQVLQQGRRNGVEVTDIDAVLLVGGTTQIPSVQRWVRNYFDEKKIKCDRPFEAIAIGALQLGKGFELKDFLYHSYGIRYWNRRKNAHSWHTLIRSGQPYPMSQPVELSLGASIDNQPNIELIIGELGSDNAATEVYFDGDRLMTRTVGGGEIVVQPLNDRDGARTIATLDPGGYPGRDRIKVQFWVDEERFLRISVEDLLTQRSLLINQIVAQLS